MPVLGKFGLFSFFHFGGHSSSMTYSTRHIPVWFQKEKINSIRVTPIVWQYTGGKRQAQGGHTSHVWPLCCLWHSVTPNFDRQNDNLWFWWSCNHVVKVILKQQNTSSTYKRTKLINSRNKLGHAPGLKNQPPPVHMFNGRSRLVDRPMLFKPICRWYTEFMYSRG